MNYPPNFHPPTKTERLQSALIALDKLHAHGDISDREYLTLVEPLKAVIGRARLVDFLDNLVASINDEDKSRWQVQPDWDSLLWNYEVHEKDQFGEVGELRLVTRRFEQVTREGFEWNPSEDG